MTDLHISRARAISDPAEWPIATCPECGLQRQRPGGGSVVCDRCSDIRAEALIERLNTERRAKLEAEREERRARLPDLLARAGCPTRYRGFTRAAWESAFGPWTGEITRALDGWTGEQPDTWLVLLWGQHGRRKTGLATALLGERIVAGKHCLWLDCLDWCKAMLDAPFERRPGDTRRTKGEIYDEARDAEVLFLDDLRGRQGDAEEQRWWATQVATLLRHREAWIMPTLATANLPPVTKDEATGKQRGGINELARIDASLVSRCDASSHVYEMTSDHDFRRTI